jgi:hypothetical protein
MTTFNFRLTGNQVGQRREEVWIECLACSSDEIAAVSKHFEQSVTEQAPNVQELRTR